MPSTTPRTLIAVLAMAWLVSACGFQLRGTGGTGFDQVDPAWLDMQLVSPAPNSELSNDLRTAFAANGINWVEPDAANFTVHLDEEQFEQRYLSLSNRGRAAELQLTLSTRFAVVDSAGVEVIPPTDSTVIRQMENDPGNVVGKAEEQRILRREMRADLVQQIIRRISYFAAAAPARATTTDTAAPEATAPDATAPDAMPTGTAAPDTAAPDTSTADAPTGGS